MSVERIPRAPSWYSSSITRWAASRRTIERNGGVYEDTRQGKLRYWVPTRG